LTFPPVTGTSTALTGLGVGDFSLDCINYNEESVITAYAAATILALSQSLKTFDKRWLVQVNLRILFTIES
jgi:hypothetical protein